MTQDEEENKISKWQERGAVNSDSKFLAPGLDPLFYITHMNNVPLLVRSGTLKPEVEETWAVIYLTDKTKWDERVAGLGVEATSIGWCSQLQLQVVA